LTNSSHKIFILIIKLVALYQQGTNLFKKALEIAETVAQVFEKTLSLRSHKKSTAIFPNIHVCDPRININCKDFFKSQNRFDYGFLITMYYNKNLFVLRFIEIIVSPSKFRPPISVIFLSLYLKNDNGKI